MLDISKSGFGVDELDGTLWPKSIPLEDRAWLVEQCKKALSQGPRSTGFIVRYWQRDDKKPASLKHLVLVDCYLYVTECALRDLGSTTVNTLEFQGF